MKIIQSSRQGSLKELQALQDKLKRIAINNSNKVEKNNSLTRLNTIFFRPSGCFSLL
ncbi:hypothetical protein LDG_8063 [Legionella drancourtii LLAP12]|uniref:Uncharacterized protein n=1 Tax=Legionella drancourtii LLAP12 TaxID=658187 RepID=G9ERZ1_9GAMM|nr:hypothetical protein LDG_8063 [Legionella drancourtii LLAP12]